MKLVAVAMFVPLVACVDSQPPSTDESATSTVNVARHGECDVLPPLPEDQEYVFWRGHTDTIRFPGFFSPQAETFFIWNLGTSIQHGAPYPSDSHGKLYGVFAPGPPGSTHHVDGQSGFDHYHIVSEGPGLRTYDVLLVFPGPNFDPATWVPPRSVAGMDAAIAAGLLAPPLLTTQAGFDPLVFKVPQRPAHGCHDDDDDGDGDSR